MENTKKIVLLDIDDTLFNTDKFKKSHLKHFELYEDVPGAIDTLSKIVVLGILSQGETMLQIKKLLETNIHHYFVEEHTHIVTIKVDAFKTLLEKYKGRGKIFFVEDRLVTLEKAKKTDPSICAVWMKRGRYAETQKLIQGFQPDYTITNLHDLIPIVKKK